MKKRVKVRKRIKPLGFIILIVIILLVVGLVGISSKFSSKPTKNELLIFKEVGKVPKLQSFDMVMVGDALIHYGVYRDAKTSDGGYDFKPMLEKMKPIISQYDLAYYNQETILGGTELGLSSYPMFNSPYEVGDAFIDAGFNLVSLATNHTLDRGENAILNSREYWNKQSNVLAVGSYSSAEERNKIHIEKANDITYTMLNYTYGTNGIQVPYGKDYLVNIWPVTGSNPATDTSYQKYKVQIKKDIDAVRDKADILIVAMHWGIEYEDSPNSYQLDAANYLESLGVDIIIGTHPHVIQPVDYINDTPVIYSLGNFASAHEVVNLSNRVGLMTSLEIEKDTKNDKITIKKLENELLYMYYTSDYKDFKIIPFSKMNTEYLSNYKEVYNTYSNIVKSMNNNIYVKPLE